MNNISLIEALRVELEEMGLHHDDESRSFMYRDLEGLIYKVGLSSYIVIEEINGAIIINYHDYSGLHKPWKHTINISDPAVDPVKIIVNELKAHHFVGK